MTLRDDYEHWARSFPRRMGEGWGVFLDAISALAFSSEVEESIDHDKIQNIGINDHPTIDTHLGHNTGHPNIEIYASEPADGTLDNNEGAFWYVIT